MLSVAARRPAFWAAALPLAALVAGSIFGSGGALELRRLHRERDALSEETFRLLRENTAIAWRIRELRQSDAALERLARQRLGLLRDGEIVYRFRTRTSAPGRSE